MSSNTGFGLQSLFPDNLFRGIHEFVTKTNGLDLMIHRGTHNRPYGFMGLVTLTAGTFTYVTYRDYANEVSDDLANALNSIQNSEFFIPADEDPLKDSLDTTNNENTVADSDSTENAVVIEDNVENIQSISGKETTEETLEKETPKESGQEGMEESSLKRDAEKEKENRKTENSPKVRFETNEQTKSNGGSKKGVLTKKTVKRRKIKR